MKTFVPHFLLAAVVVLTYGNTLQHSFHFDDFPSILEKPWIRGLDKIPMFIFSFAQRPLVILSLNLNYAISEFEVWSYHVFNICFHLTAVLLLYRLARLILVWNGRNDATASTALTAMPLLAALLFALHPLNTQAVTYISSRSSIMATIFYLATLVLFFEAVLKKESGNLKSAVCCGVGAVISFGLGFLCKLIVITLPAVLFMFHFYFVSRKTFQPWLAEQWKWIAGISGVLVLAILYKKFLGGGLLSASPTGFTSEVYLLTQTAVIPFEYFRKMLFPFNLTIDPDFQAITDWTSAAALGGMLILASFIVLWVKFSSFSERSRGYGPEAFGLGWILLTLLPTSSVVPLLDMAVEHRTYLPLVGFSIASAAICLRLGNVLLETATTAGPVTGPRFAAMARMAFVCVLLVLLFFFVGTKDRNRVWKDEVTLWSDAKKKTPFMPRAYNNLGEAYDKLGDYDRAIPEFEAGLKLNSNYFIALSNLGNVYGKKKEYAKAIGYFERALKEKPDYAPGHYNLAKALHVTGHPEKAAESYRLALKSRPYFEEALFNLAFLALELGQPQEAVERFNKFLEMQPANPKAHFGLGNAYAMLKQPEAAIESYQHAIESDPAFLSPYINLANLNMATGRTDEAKVLLENVLSRQPNVAGVHKNLGLIYLQEKDSANAVRHLKEYLRLTPQAPDASAIRSVLEDLMPSSH
ncbi:MAG: tetratricopeptide repeat protein [Nitrospinae bacterium]|nr:tetratricopeptide repeat protein [Nitrospinota bacterium]